jgi:hypothetical protein
MRVREWLIRSVDERGQVDRAGYLRRPAVPSRIRSSADGFGDELLVDGV